jgi:hypothetical protein
MAIANDGEGRWLTQQQQSEREREREREHNKKRDTASITDAKEKSNNVK